LSDLLWSFEIKRDKEREREREIEREGTNYYGKAEKEVRKVGIDDGAKQSQMTKTCTTNHFFCPISKVSSCSIYFHFLLLFYQI
jgi:hypothetical protein